MTAEIEPYIPGQDEWATIVAQSDEVLGFELVSGDQADKLLGVPFVIIRATFREGVQRPHVPWRDDYVSCEAVVAPRPVLQDRERKGRLRDPQTGAVRKVDELPVDPGEHIVFNDGSTGIYRQIVQYLATKGYITLPDGKAQGGKGDSIFDLPRSQWQTGGEEATSGINIRLFCPRGLRYSEYTNEYNPDGSKTRYIG